jgi:S-formylglutathione hydrolase FrmB
MRRLIFFIFFTLSLQVCARAQRVTIIDTVHYSNVLAEIRHYRIFLPPGYENGTKCYPVIYFLHGWGQRYFGEGEYKYAAYDSGNDNKGDNIGNYVAAHNVIVVKSDGYNRSPGEPYYPRPYNVGPVETYRQFPIYFPELIEYIDQHYRTVADREHRAISGLSMGGFMTFWISAKYPDLFSAAGSFCGSPEFVVGPKDFQTEYRHVDMYKNFGGVKLRLHFGDRDFIRQYHEETNSVWSQIMNNYQWKMFPAEHSTCGMGEMFDSLMSSFVHPLPRPLAWNHTDVYPNFRVWGYTLTSNRSVPGFTVLENVGRNGFRCTVREFLPDGQILSNVKMWVLTDSVYKKNTSYQITDIDHATGKSNRYPLTSDGAGRLRISFSGSCHDIGISEHGNEPDVILDTVTVVNAPWPVAGKEIGLRLRLLNKGGMQANNVNINITPTRGSTSVINGSAVVGSILPDRNGENEALLVIRTADTVKVCRFNVSIRSGKYKWKADFVLNLKPAAGSGIEFIVADGKEFTVVAHGNDSATIRLGDGNGDGVVNAGETIEILARDSGKFYRTALTTSGECFNPNGVHPRESDYWGNFDNVGASQKINQLVISNNCAGNSPQPVLFEYWKADEGKRHVIKYGIANIVIKK